MDNEETHRLGVVGYDEESETWYVQSPESHRLMLTRRSLGRLVQLYNTIHKGNALVLIEQREVRRLEEARQRHSEALRDLYLFLERRRRHSPLGLLRRIFNRLRPRRDASA